MNSRIALLQASLDLPPVESLQRAFRSIRSLVASDAWTVAKDAYGILVKNLSPEDATILQAALEAEGVRTVAVAEGDLPKLPAVKFVRQLDCLPEALFIYDPIGRRIPVPWAHVELVAAGAVQHFEPRPAASRRPLGTPGASAVDLDGVWGLGTRSHGGADRDDPGTVLVLEILLAGAVMRFQAHADRLRFDYLEDRASSDAGRNLGLMVGDMTRFAPHSRLNRGAAALRSEPPALLVYPSKNAFYEEMIWMLWSQGQAAAGETG